jgi:hypothetical protein
MPGERAVPRATATRGLRSDVVAVVLALLVVVILGGVAVVDPALAARLSAENQAVEWIQATLCVGAALAMAARAGARLAAGRPAALEILMAAGFAGLFIGEVDLDKRVLGVKIISTRFFVDGRVGLPWRALAVLVVVGVPLALAIFAVVRRGEIWREGRRLLGTPRGRVLAAGLVLFGITELFEGALGRVPGLPRLFMEELLELTASIGFFIGAVARH